MGSTPPPRGGNSRKEHPANAGIDRGARCSRGSSVTNDADRSHIHPGYPGIDQSSGRSSAGTPARAGIKPLRRRSRHRMRGIAPDKAKLAARAEMNHDVRVPGNPNPETPGINRLQSSSRAPARAGIKARHRGLPPEPRDRGLTNATRINPSGRPQLQASTPAWAGIDRSARRPSSRDNVHHPPARGSIPPGRLRERRPAGAEINPAYWCGLVRQKDIPPQTRGWTHGAVEGGMARPGFPAHAGINLCGLSSTRLPRVRGDQPGRGRQASVMHGNPAGAGIDPSMRLPPGSAPTPAPRARGSTMKTKPARNRPLQAGIDRHTGSPGGRESNGPPPAVAGIDPGLNTQNAAIDRVYADSTATRPRRATPQARGSTPSRRCRRTPHTIPRGRGDRPVRATGWNARRLATRRRRGSTLSKRHVVYAALDRPARAGIDRPTPASSGDSRSPADTGD